MVWHFSTDQQVAVICWDMQHNSREEEGWCKQCRCQTTLVSNAECKQEENKKTPRSALNCCSYRHLQPCRVHCSAMIRVKPNCSCLKIWSETELKHPFLPLWHLPRAGLTLMLILVLCLHAGSGRDQRHSAFRSSVPPIIVKPVSLEQMEGIFSNLAQKVRFGSKMNFLEFGGLGSRSGSLWPHNNSIIHLLITTNFHTIV